ncbi:MAG: glycosyltransferase family 2 protein, partial [Pseudomonadota bacterium]
WVSGAAVMFRMAALRQTGFFDPAYFLYFEEVDLMLRLTRAGWQVWYVPEARVMHMEGAATGVGSGAAMRRPRPAYWYQSWRTYFAKNYGRAYALAAAALYVIGGAIGVVVAKVMGRAPYLPANFFRDFRVGVIGPLLGQRPPEA